MRSDSAWREKVVLAYIEEPPFGWTDGHASATGSDIELAGEILCSIGVQTIEHRQTTFAELLPGVENGRWDINVPLFVTPERAARVDFSLPVWALHDGFLVRTGNPKSLTGYHALARHDDARLGVITGQVQHDAARRAGVPDARIQQFNEQQQALDALLGGRIDAYASTALGNRTLAQRAGNGALSAVPHDPQAATADSPPKGAFSFSRANTSLREAFDRQLRRYLGSPDHRLRMTRYGFTAAEINPVAGG